MEDHPVDLDEHRSTAGRMATNMRRHSLKEFEANREALRRSQEELETQLLAEPAETWPEAAAKAQYLIRLYGDTLEGRDGRRKKLVERALGDLAQLMDREGE